VTRVGVEDARVPQVAVVQASPVLVSTVKLAVRMSPDTSFATRMLNVIGVVVPAKIGKGSTVEMVNGPGVTVKVKI
jgi:hypothetical protein